MATIEVFLGSYECKDLIEFGGSAQKRGAIVEPLWSSEFGVGDTARRRVFEMLESTENPVIHIAGSALPYCIADAVKELIGRGVPVVVNLASSRMDENDCSNDPAAMVLIRRMLSLQDSLPRVVRESPLLKLV